MVTARGKLRQQAMDLSGGMCDWPQCPRPAVELAHLHSIGMGGRKSADTLSNVAVFCWNHARASDGLYRNRDWYEEQLALIGVDWPFKAWEIAEALTVHIAKGRP